MNDIQIITQIREGNQKGFRKLYDYFPIIQKWLITNGCEKNQSQDIFQQALLVLCEKCQNEHFTLTATLETYLFSVSKFVWYNQARKKSKHATSDISEIEIAASNDVDEMAEKETKLEYAFKALELISARCREMLQLFYLKKKTMAEIAKQLSFKSEIVAKNQKYKCLQFAKAKAFQLIKL